MLLNANLGFKHSSIDRKMANMNSESRDAILFLVFIFIGMLFTVFIQVAVRYLGL